ncbi:MAG TPA: SHOCT domain-containing protein [Anaerolineae bacterium]|nr:SHOCT domain-containing protein [Anaerolineae bacterium]
MKSRSIVIGVAAGVVALLLVGLLAVVWLGSQNGYGMMGGYGFPWGMHSLGGMQTFGGGIWMLVFWAVVLGGGVWLLSGLARQGRSEAQPADRPLDIARQRYARGEIDREEFERIRETLRS